MVITFLLPVLQLKLPLMIFLTFFMLIRFGSTGRTFWVNYIQPLPCCVAFRTGRSNCNSVWNLQANAAPAISKKQLVKWLQEDDVSSKTAATDDDMDDRPGKWSPFSVCSFVVLYKTTLACRFLSMAISTEFGPVIYSLQYNVTLVVVVSLTMWTSMNEY